MRMMRWFTTTTLIGLLALASGVSLLWLFAYGPAWNHTLLEVLRDVGISLVVAGFLVLTIEQVSRREIRNEVSDLVQLALAKMQEQHVDELFRAFMPSEVFDFLRSNVIQPRFFREADEWVVRFLDVDRDAGIVHCQVAGTYELVNWTDHPSEYEIRFTQSEALTQ